MSASPAEGVVDANLRVHETDNVFVCSNAVFPNVGAVNPTLTLVALALRLGDHLSAPATKSRSQTAEQSGSVDDRVFA